MRCPLPPRRPLTPAWAALLLCVAPACSRHVRADASPPLAAELPAAAAAEAARRAPEDGAALSADEQVGHALSRVTFGPRPQDRDRVARIGLSAYLEEQLKPGQLDDSALESKLEGLPVLHRDTGQLSTELNHYRQAQKEKREAEAKAEAMAAPASAPAPEAAASAAPARPPVEAPPLVMAQGAPGPGPAARPDRPRGLRKTLGKLGRGPGFDFTVQLAEAKLARAVYSERQLLEVMDDFWFNHFNVFAGKDREAALLPGYEREVIRPNALGSFRDLLVATARSPAMLIYLDNWRSTTDREEPRRPWWAWARPPAKVKVPSARKRGSGLNENYARELLELHTLGVDGGYTQRDVTEVARCFTGWTVQDAQEDPRFTFRPKQHDRGTKTVLGHTIAAGGGVEDGEQVLEILLKHPSTAKNLATKLVRRFVSDEPPAEAVATVAAAYLKTRGDIPSMLRALFGSPDFWSRKALRSKMRSPLELVAGSARSLGATVEEPLSLAKAVARIGEPLYAAAPPTGYADTAEAWATSGALLARIDFGLQLAQGQLDGVEVDLSALSAGAHGHEEVLDRAARSLGLGASALSDRTRGYILEQLREVSVEKKPEQVAQRAVGLLLGAPELQRR
jgi:uncharacterized protein (DUF1800 family)